MTAYSFADRLDVVGNPTARFALIPFEDIDGNGWECCRNVDRSADAGVAVGEATALVPVEHWYDHELRAATNQHLADILVSPGLTAGARRPDGTYPRYTELDFELAQVRRESAKTVLRERGFAEEQIAQIESGQLWPEG